MSSDEDDDGFELQSITAATAAKAVVAGLTTEKVAFDKVAYSELYKEATSEMKEENAKIFAGQVTSELCKAFPHREGQCFFFTGHIEEKLATDLYVSATDFYDHKSGALVIKHMEGKSKATTTMPGFSTYEHHLGAHNPTEQQAASVFFTDTFLKKANWAKKMWPELYAVYTAAKKMVDPDDSVFEPVCGHMLFCWSKSVCWQYHQDSNEIRMKGKERRVDLSVILELSGSCSSVEFACNSEGKPVFYEKPGSLVAFDANAWHRSGVKYANTVMIAFFFKLKTKKGEEPAAAGSSGDGADGHDNGKGSGKARNPGSKEIVEKEAAEEEATAPAEQQATDPEEKKSEEKKQEAEEPEVDQSEVEQPADKEGKGSAVETAPTEAAPAEETAPAETTPGGRPKRKAAAPAEAAAGVPEKKQEEVKVKKEKKDPTSKVAGSKRAGRS